jgi:hypothetical protein
VAVGNGAGGTSQGNSAVAIGVGAGQSTQGVEAIAIGNTAGSLTQGTSAIAIGKGAGRNFQGNNSIILNATGNILEQTTANTFTVAPVRNDVANVAEILFYNITTKEITYSNTISVAVANSLIMVASAPANNKGAGGDTKGMVYLANNYFYYCTANYDGTTNVWSRIASTDAW